MIATPTRTTARFPQRQVLQIPGVTGRGTDANPYRGWIAAVNASPAGTVNFFDQGIFDGEGVELKFTNRRVSVIGVGQEVTVIRNAVAGAGKAVAKWWRDTDVEDRGVRIANLTLDGGGVTEIGLCLRDVNYSTIENVSVRNCTQYAGWTSRGITNVWIGFRCHGADQDVFPTPNGLYLGGADGIKVDTAVTCSEFIGLEIAELSGVGLEHKVGFSCRFAGAVEVCGKNLKTNALTRDDEFDGIDFEEATASPGLEIGGFNHVFVHNDCTGSNVLINGTGGLVFDRVITNTITDNGTGINDWYTNNGAPLTIAGSNAANNKIHDRDTLYRKGANVTTFNSTDGTAAGLRLFLTGTREAGMVTFGADRTYFISGGGVGGAGFASPVDAAAASAISIDGNNAWVTGTLNAPLISGRSISLATSGTNAAQVDFGTFAAHLTSPNGDLVIAVPGQTATMRFLPFGSDIYAENSANGDIIFRANGGVEKFRITKEGWLKLANATAPGANPSGGSYVYAEGGATKARGSSGTVTTLANA